MAANKRGSPCQRVPSLHGDTVWILLPRPSYFSIVYGKVGNTGEHQPPRQEDALGHPYEPRWSLALSCSWATLQGQTGTS